MNRHDREVEGFSYHFDFRRQRKRCSWSGARLHHSLATVGARRLLSTPSIEPFGSRLGSVLARMLTASRAFAEFDGLHLRGFPWRAQITLSPLCLPISPLGLAWFVSEPMFRLATPGLFQLYTSTDPYMTPSSQRAVGAICTKAQETRAISSSAPTSPMRKRLDKGDFKSRVSTSFTIRAAREILAQPVAISATFPQRAGWCSMRLGLADERDRSPRDSN